ncbi:MAG: hypothetical protein K9G49_02570 [Taibaiella sp.]|nr:hypothetical protein [Taibaiella sp.]
MKLSFFSLLLLLIGTWNVCAQADNANLLAQSPDGKTVKLVWVLKSVSGNIPGFDIKRKDGLGPWKLLNKETLLPGISLKKNLTQFESDNVESSRIKEKLKDLLKNGKLKEYDYNTFLEKWKNNEKEIHDIIYLAALDFDVSLICGFGFVDHTITQKMDYQYGLFIHGTDRLLDKVSWNYGEIPDLNVIKEITSKSLPGKKGVQVIWNAAVDKMKTSYVAGFNIYKRGIRLNERPINMPNPDDPSEFTWNDATADAGVEDQYSISTQSLFGIEGIIKPYTYNPADHPAEYQKAVVSNIESLGFYFKDGISIQWTFPKEYEQYIKGFYIEKDNMPDGYKRVSELIPADTRTYIDKTGSSVSSNIRMRVSAKYNDKTLVDGTELLYSYFPMTDPPRPLNIRSSSSVDNKINLVRFTWDPVIRGDSVTQYYRIYMLAPEFNTYTILADNLPLKQTTYTHSIPPGVAANYQYYVTGLSKIGIESRASDTVSVQTKSTLLPVPTIIKSLPDGKKVTLQWQYPDIADHTGFILYNDGAVIADEKILKKNTREYITAEMLPGTTGNFSIMAITEKGVYSERTPPVSVTILAAGKK